MFFKRERQKERGGIPRLVFIVLYHSESSLTLECVACRRDEVKSGYISEWD